MYEFRCVMTKYYSRIWILYSFLGNVFFIMYLFSQSYLYWLGQKSLNIFSTAVVKISNVSYSLSNLEHKFTTESGYNHIFYCKFRYFFFLQKLFNYIMFRINALLDKTRLNLSKRKFIITVYERRGNFVLTFWLNYIIISV